MKQFISLILVCFMVTVVFKNGERVVFENAKYCYTKNYGKNYILYDKNHIEIVKIPLDGVLYILKEQK